MSLFSYEEICKDCVHSQFYKKRFINCKYDHEEKVNGYKGTCNFKLTTHIQMSKETQYPTLELDLSKEQIDKIINTEVLKINGKVFISELKTKTMVAEFAKEQVTELQTERDSLKEQVETNEFDLSHYKGLLEFYKLKSSTLQEQNEVLNRVNLSLHDSIETLQSQADKLAEAIRKYHEADGSISVDEMLEALSTYKQSKK